MLALVADDKALNQMREIVATVPQLEPWIHRVERHQSDRRLFEAIVKVVISRGSCLQTEMKGLLAEDDGRRVAQLISYLEKAGKIVRVKTGRTYRLLPPGAPDVPAPPKPRIVTSHRTDRRAPRLREIDVSSLTYVPLPRSPLRWEEAQADRQRRPNPEAEEQFSIADAEWRIALVEKIPMSERPDPAFRQIHTTKAGVIAVDDLGRADGLGQIDAAALRYDRAGQLVAKKRLQHGVYRVGVHPLGRGMIAMSRDAVLHVYDENLDSILETSLASAPEVAALKKRFEIQDPQLKNHIRCVGLSSDASHYLFTTVDEAWCVDMNGSGLWGAKLPIKDGWRRVASVGTEVATSREVSRALKLMDLSFPVTPEEVKRRYRTLAKQWHPDVNPQDPHATERMKALTGAAAALTGIEARALPHYTGATFVRDGAQTEFDVAGIRVAVNFSMEMGELHASDWIYAAGFAAESTAAYLAGYSGRVVLVNEHGEGVRVYDIGTVPRRIIDTGDYLYLLTDTRLYVLHNEALHSIVDTFDGGDLVVCETAFGLLEKKRLRWFREDGQYLGSVVSKDPIRRVYATNAGMVVETRQRRATVHGVPKWWA